MTTFSYFTQVIETPSLRLEFFRVPWDTEIFSFPVGQIAAITCTDFSGAQNDFAEFERWRDDLGIKLASCRLSHDRLAESMFLEQRGFRFVEMIYQPQLRAVQTATFGKIPLEISTAAAPDLPVLEEIAGTAFKTDRFHLDPRLNPDLADRRYRSWARNGLAHPSQRLLKITKAGVILAFFIVEHLPQNRCYWHLTAMSPEMQGKGLGKQVWRAMIMHHRNEGIETIETTISAHNIAVMNLYAGLGFRFRPPSMTFHWLRS